MSTRVAERVDDWSERPFDGGFGELQTLAESDFSGVVRAGGAELFMTRGVAVGIRRGAIDDFADGSGTVYEAPTDPLPLLAVMQERSDEVRAKYYSEDTGISDIDRTLESGGFTGFVELSENVLSGDYYLVYHQGHSMSVAYVGTTQQLLTGDEAFERTDDEVGIYEVRPVEITAIEIPSPPEPEPDPPAATAPETEPADSDPAVADESDSENAATVVGDADGSSDPLATDEPATGPASTGAAAPTGERSGDETGTSDPVGPESDTDDGPEPTKTDQVVETADIEGDDPHRETAESVAESQPPDADTADRPRPEQLDSETEQADVPASEPLAPDSADQGSETAEVSTDTGSGTAAGRTAATRTEPAPADSSSRAETAPHDDVPPTPAPAVSDPAAESAEDEETSTSDGPVSLETRAIPSLDPERTNARSGASSSEPRRDAPGREDERRASADGTGVQSTDRPERASNRRQQPDADRVTRPEGTRDGAGAASEATVEPTAGEEGAGSGSESAEATEQRVDGLQERLTERREEIDRLASSLDTAKAERDTVQRELDSVRGERDDLRERVEELEAELERLEADLGAVTDTQRRLTPQEALSGTDVFVRYRSKGDATLEKAHQSGAIKKDVVENLRLENHTQFDAERSAVGGREYDQFLEETVAYEFVHWVVEDLIFEIQGTGHTETLSELYDALPKINRVELNGTVNVTDTNDGQETQTTETFDVVFRERMGDPLLVANINDSREGASDAMMGRLITAAERVGQTSDQFAAAFLVTESFFEPAALETVAEATRGGILSRDKRKSFVNLSRKRGYHLCLVEARNQNFHLEVPEL